MSHDVNRGQYAWSSEVEKLRAERDSLQARLDRVSELADRLIRHGDDCHCYICVPVHNLCAALDEGAAP